MARLQNGMSGLEGNGRDMGKTGLQDWAFEDGGRKGEERREKTTLKLCSWEHSFVDEIAMLAI